MKKIKIIHGQEFKYIRDVVEDDDVFIQQYQLAARCLDEIVKANGSPKEVAGNSKNVDCLNNIIAFTGDRGQGKTSAMMSFTGELLNRRDNSAINFTDQIKQTDFLELDIIDPSTFEEMHNVVEVVVTKMFNAYEEEWSKLKQTQKADTNSPSYKNIFKSFQSVYEGLSLVRNSKKFDDLEQDYEGTITKISRAGDSAKLKQNMQKLVDEYLAFFVEIGKLNCNSNKPPFLVIPIDDLDVNISLAYKMMEQIRKYLILPNVILIMAVKVEQLRYCAELQFRREMAPLIEKDRRIYDQEPIDMATKYVAKLIPDARRIALPELRILVGKMDEADLLEVEYLKDDVNLFALEDKESQENELTLEEILLITINRLTGLVFVCNNKQIHPIVPQTLRELVTFSSVLGKMEENEHLKNIEIFEDYFVNSWIPAHLDDGYVRNIHSLYQVQTPALHLTLSTILLDKLENLSAYTLDTVGNKDNQLAFALLKQNIFKKSQIKLSLGDIVSLLNFMEYRYIDQTVKHFVYSVRTVYSIIMRKMILKKQYYNLGTFVGGSVFGKEIVAEKNQYVFSSDSRIRKMIQGNWTDKISRAEFVYDSKKLLNITSNYLSKETQSQQQKKINRLLFFSNFSDDRQYFVSGNYAIDTAPTFSLENIFISILFNFESKLSENNDSGKNASITHKRIEIVSKATTNLELLELVCTVCEQKKDPGFDANNTDHVLHFFNNVNRVTQPYFFGEEFLSQPDIEVLVTSFEEFWECRVNPNSVLRNHLRTKLREQLNDLKLSRVCAHTTFQKRATDLLQKCKNISFLNNEDVKAILAEIESQLEESKQSFKGEIISQQDKLSFNNCIDDLIEFINDLGDEM